MTPSIKSFSAEACAHVVRALAGFIIVMGCLVLLGWRFDIPGLKSGMPGLTAMNPGGTAVSFLLTAAALWLLNLPSRPWALRAARLCALGVMAIAVTRLAGYGLHWDGGPDQFLFRAKLDREALMVGHVNRMAPNTAAAFFLTSLALLLVDVPLRRVWPAQILAGMVALVALPTIVGYAYSSMALAGVRQFIPMAINTGVGFALVSFAIFYLRPDHGIMKVLVSGGGAGVMARRLLPLVVAIPAAVGWVLCYAQSKSVLGEVMALSFFVLANILIFAALVLWTAITLSRLEKKLRDSELRYKLALKGSNDGLWDWNLIENELYWSDRFREMLEITDDTFKPHYDEFKLRLHPDDHHRITEELENHTKTHTPYDAEFRMRTDTGKYIWVRARGASVWDEDGRTTRMSGAVTDITNWKMAELELRESREQAGKESQIKSEFLANMSHELRTPLNSIIGLTRMLYEDNTLDAEHRDMVGVAYRSADNLLDIVNDILDLSKVESGQLVLENITFSLQEVLDNVRETILPLSSEKGLSFTCNFPTGSLPYFIGDPMRLGRIIINIVGNGVKYTDKGGVTFDVVCLPENGGKCVIEFMVTDTGIGIPESKQDVIFSKFAQADSSITRRYGGTGLGLAITKQLVEKMGGDIGFASREGQGSRFWIRVPFAVAEDRPEIDKGAFLRENIVRLPPEQRKSSADLHILLAEDHIMNQAFMRRLLPRMGLKDFDIVENGTAVLEALDKKHYDLIMMDCHMPVMSGYDATREIRRREKETGGHVPIVAMTADAMMGTRERCLKAGMDDYISKPLNQDELRHILAHWVTFTDETPGGSVAGEIARKAGKVIDLAVLSEFADDISELHKFIGIFLLDSAENVDIMRHNRGAGESPAWTGAAHKLKGGAGMLGAEKLRSLCERAQHMRVATISDRRRVFGEIDAEYARVRDALEKVLAGA